MHFPARPWVLLLCYALCFTVRAHGETQSAPFVGDVVKSGDLRPLVLTEFGRVAGARVSDGNETFLLHFITLDPNSLFLPVLLHQDMVFYVHTGSGRLSFSGDEEMHTVDLERGDVFRLESGTVFFVQSNLDPVRQKLRIHAIFGDLGEDLRDPIPYGPYSSIRDLILGFDNRTLQEAFKVPEEVIEQLRGGQKPEAIIHGVQQTEISKGNKERELVEKFLMSRGAFGYGVFDITNKHNKKDLYNIFSEKRDFENCNGWSTTVTKKKSSVFKHSKFGLFMVNLTHGGMMGPHWNPRATEIAVVLEGKGMVRVVCPGTVRIRECRSSRFAVEEGDIFVVPRFHPMAQLAFNNDSFVFVGFSTAVKANHPQYIAGRASVLRTLDKHILAMSFGVNDTTLDRIVNPQGQSVILSCVSCAEEEYRVMTEEIQREREEETREREEEERRRKQEEAAAREREEAARKREQEEAARRAEEERRAREQREAEQREEEQKRAEEERKQQEEEEARSQREAEERRAEQEREAQRQREEEERRRQQAEAARREQEAREAAAAERAAQEEREAAARREEEEARHQEQGQGQQPGGGGQGQGEQPGGGPGQQQQPGGGQGQGEHQPGGWQGQGEHQPGGGQGHGEHQPGGGQGQQQQPGGGQGQGEQQPGGGQGRGEQQPPQEEGETRGQQGQGGGTGES